MSEQGGYDGKVVARVEDVDAIRQIIRTRAEENSLARRVLDELAGLTAGHSEKLLSEPPMKKFGPVSLFPLIGAVGLEVYLVETAAAMRRVHRAPKRDDGKVRHGLEHWRNAKALGIAVEIARQHGAAGGKKRFEAMSEQEKREHQSRAAKLRWRRWREKRRLAAEAAESAASASRVA